MASSRRNLCDDILRLIDEALADHERLAVVTAVTATGRGGVPALASVTASARRSGSGSG